MADNLKVLQAIRIKGKHVEVGSVISKKDFESKGDWMDLCLMQPQRLAETEEKIGSVKAAMPGVGK